MPLVPEPKPLTVTVTIQYGDDEPDVRTYTPDTVTIDRDKTANNRPGGALREDVHTTIVRMETRTLELLTSPTPQAPQQNAGGLFRARKDTP